MTISELLRQMLLALQSGDTSAAATLCQQGQRAFPLAPDFLMVMASDTYAKGDMDQTTAYLLQACGCNLADTRPRWIHARLATLLLTQQPLPASFWDLLKNVEQSKTLMFYGQSLLAPQSHMLDAYATTHKRYGLPVVEAWTAWTETHPAQMLDIGANIGDTLATCARAHDGAFYAVEGDAGFLPYLLHNNAFQGVKAQTAPVFLGPQDQNVTVESVDGSSALKPAQTGQKAVQIVSFDQLLAAHPTFAEASFVKIDTDGFDFKIMNLMAPWIQTRQPALFFEYDPSLGGEAESLAAIDTLVALGYRDMLIYDNFGHLVTACRADHAAVFRNMNRYLRSHIKFGRAVYYYDILALPPSGAGVSDKLVAQQETTALLKP